VARCPLHAHWLEGEPITGVAAMGGVLDRYRRFVVEGEPVATGIAPVGDAWACSNPSLGRGMSLGLWHVHHLLKVIREHLEEPSRFAEAWDAVTEAELTPWYRETVEEDRARMAEIEALRHGLEPKPPSTSTAALLPALRLALARDPDAFRAFIASRSCVRLLGESFANRALAERILTLARDSGPPPLPGPDRAELLALLERTPAAV
jgi:flavin-dependent dehydrogenase